MYFFDNQNTKYFENLCWIRNSVFFSRFLAGQRNPCRGRSVPWPLFGAFDFPRSRTVEVDTFFAICFGWTCFTFQGYLNTDTWHNSKPLRCSWSMEVGKYEVCWVQLDSNTLRKILYVTQLVWIPGSKAQDVMSRVQPNVPSQHSELESGVACRVAVWCCWLWQPMLIHYSHGNLCAL